tara:strand:- start:102 stop:662 length:561 start_codon:yes stop_codon:yes gene_type:complete
MSFDEFWGMYPRRTQKIHAKKAYSKAIKVASHEDIMSGLAHQLRHGDWKDIQFVPYPATWLNRGGWHVDDKLEADYRERTQSNQRLTEANRKALALLDADSSPLWVAAIDRLRSAGNLSAYTIKEWFSRTRGVVQDNRMHVYCLDEVNAQWLHQEYQEHVDAALQMEWEAMSIDMLDQSYEEPEEL